MKVRYYLPAITLVATLGFSVGCDVDVTEEGRMPSMEVDPGEMPEVDVDTADVDMHMEEKTVSVPDVDVSTKEKTMSVPDIDITGPDND